MSGGVYEALQKVIRQTAEGLVLTDYCLGTVETESPLTIRISQKDLVEEPFLLLTDAVRDHYVDMTVSHTTENRAGGGGYAEFASHNHDYTGRKKFLVHESLHAGEIVVMLRQQGGQQYLVLSRIHDHENLSGEWA